MTFPLHSKLTVQPFPYLSANYMPEIIFATPEDLKQPVGGLVVESPQDEDHVLGAEGATGPDFDVLVDDGQWANYAPNPELQRNRFGDTYMCVSFSANNIAEFLVKRQYDEFVNWSDIFLGIGSGTIRGSGNGKRKVADWRRLNGYVLESDYPYTQDMTLDQVYSPLSASLLALGKKNLNFYSFLYKWLGDNSVQSLMNGLKYSPLQVDVSGSYRMDANGYVIWDESNPVYAHEVAIFGYEYGKCWYVFDSETLQYLRFAWNYPFGSPMIHAVKRNMHIEILKKKGGSALCVKTSGEPSLIAFSGGDITAETLFKSLYGISDFKQIPITEVAEWPYPIKHVFHSQAYQGE